MTAVKYPCVKVKVGDKRRLTFPITDEDGNAIPLTGGTARFRIGTVGSAAMLELTTAEETEIDIDEGVPASLQDAKNVTVNFQGEDIQVDGEQFVGTTYSQLFLTLEGEELVVAEGPILVEGIILPAS